GPGSWSGAAAGTAPAEEKSPRRCRRGPGQDASVSALRRGRVHAARPGVFRLEFRLGFHPVLHVGPVRPSALHPLLIGPRRVLVVGALEGGRGGGGGGGSHASGHVLPLLEGLPYLSGPDPRGGGIPPHPPPLRKRFLEKTLPFCRTPGRGRFSVRQT